MGPWSKGTLRRMRIKRPRFKSNRGHKTADVDLKQVNCLNVQ